MEKYIIIYQSVVNGVAKMTYHSGIYENKNKGTMNVHAEKLTTDRNEAAIFFDDEEALKVSRLFETSIHKLAAIAKF